MDALAAQVIQSQTSLTGVQPKLSLNLQKHEGCNRLTIVGNGKKSRLNLADFLKASSTMGIEERVTLQMIDSMRKVLPVWEEHIRDSFLSEEMKKNYWEVITRRMYSLEK